MRHQHSSLVTPVADQRIFIFIAYTTLLIGLLNLPHYLQLLPPALHSQEPQDSVRRATHLVTSASYANILCISTRANALT